MDTNQDPTSDGRVKGKQLRFEFQSNVRTFAALKQPVITGGPQHYQNRNPLFRSGLKAMTSGSVMMIRLK